MLPNLLKIGVVAVLGLFALKIVFGLLGPLVALLLVLLGVALKVALIGGVAYVVVRVISPDTAKRITGAFRR